MRIRLISAQVDFRNFISVRPDSEQSLSYFIERGESKASHPEHIVIVRGEGLNLRLANSPAVPWSLVTVFNSPNLIFHVGMNCECC
jgi:hypothetical protein